ncbi:DUF1643 domain-containing protein [Blastopirellula sp. JC732]|uniref:DUF1643 domain-containing protein n=1 Tax=Blastopirellula sediminis TaxID=2894196 RepID=A0A9X1MME1_9BACT|nr:DUF1643 domain-containing protein [Blastopirellula sediminis]MCC9606912.1 DUF1643 domain-containing protein [Blastopirellula sediminis]MCC9629793.1 DUF1643 domain-containing protein [Blastopirellula sediminis]
MPPFLPAAELKKTYDIFGHFYTVAVSPDEVASCRSVLEIIDKECTPGDVNIICDRQPDAVFIMMNPGSSQPLVEVNNHIDADQIGDLAISLVPTKPDTTQYQVMRVMRHCGWRHVRVLNLSDLRSPKSPVFIKTFERLEADHDYVAHSIFSPARKKELTKKLPQSRDTPLVFAWGLSEKLSPLIERCLNAIPAKQNFTGLLAEGTEDKYRHPLPTLQRDKEIWFQNMIRLCET